MVAEKRSSYEEIRQRTIEENKKKLEELNLSLLTKSLRETASPKPYPALSLSLSILLRIRVF
ncbi:B3 domain-containing protein [Acorus calamus]|uniref:B3 domain-containing protein n=1 Tax=Acorus calamus TaxID=4465 RepID=A0AAV9DLG1_ACOCL|nr:B3 domain-containing protein [Acorus calamus]